MAKPAVVCAVVRVMDLAVLWGRCCGLCCGEGDGFGCAMAKPAVVCPLRMVGLFVLWGR